jgi:TatD DNase family protein
MSSELVDTHVHLCDPVFDPDRQDVLARARRSGVGAVLAVGETLQDAAANLELSESYAEVLPAAGLYPANADMSKAEEMCAFIRRERARLAAIGEVGLDFRITESASEQELQREVFRMFIRLSLELDLPLNVHSRSAGRYAAALLLEEGAKRVQMHAFDGKAGSAAPAVEAGFFFSVPPSVSRSRQKQKLVKQLPLSCLLLETDAPVLGPSPEERNEPANLTVSLQAVAEIKDVPEEQVREAVVENTARLYGNLGGNTGS